jgi:hypothetical protein
MMTDLLAMTEYTVPLGIVLVFLVAAWIAKARHYSAYELIDLHRKIHEEQERNALFKQKREERRNREL